jgi:hypothetical protein
MLLGASVMLAGSQDVRAAPAPLPRKKADDSLLRHVRGVLAARGYRLHEMKPGANRGEWRLRISEPGGPPSEVVIGPVRVEHLLDAEFLGIVVELARIHDPRRDSLDPRVVIPERR